MADYNRYGSNEYGSSWRDDRDYDRNRGYGAYGQTGGYGSSDMGTDYRNTDRGYSASRQSDYNYGRRDNERFDNYDEGRRVAINETDRLIASDKVEGTRVYDRRGNRLGHIENFMVEKRSGKVEYAVLSFGGFLGMGERHYPLPWHQLTYNENMGGYVVDISERDLERAPSHRVGESPSYDRGYGSDIHSYYGTRH